MTQFESNAKLAGKRVFITAADTYMGPAISSRFAREGAEIVADAHDYAGLPDLPKQLLADAGAIDILVVNLSGMLRSADGGSAGASSVTCPAHKQGEDHWQSLFERIPSITMRFVQAILPQMIARKQGKIIAVTSAAPLRAVPGASAYTAARGAQNAYVMAVGAEIAKHNIQFNAIAQNFVIGGYPENSMDIPEIRERVLAEVPAQRLASGEEQAALGLFLASNESDFLNGQVIPFSGGWIPR